MKSAISRRSLLNIRIVIYLSWPAFKGRYLALSTLGQGFVLIDYPRQGFIPKRNNIGYNFLDDRIKLGMRLRMKIVDIAQCS